MKAAVLINQKEPLLVENIGLPETLKRGQVLVRIHYSTICGAQINEYLGTKGPDKYLPHLLGHEGAGVVEKCGPGVTTVKTGDKVVLHWRKGSGIESETPNYQIDGKKLNAGCVTTFSEYSVVSENRVTTIPSNSDLKTAPLYGCAVTTAFGILQNECHAKSGESILIFGVGGIGCSLIIASKLISLLPITAVDIDDTKLMIAKKFGADVTINSKKQNVKNIIESLYPMGVDIAAETTGINKVKEEAFDLTSNEGKTVFVGVTKPGDKVYIDSTPLHFGKKLITSYGGSCNPSYDIPRLIKLQQAGNMDLDGMITHEFSLNNINDAFNHMLENRGIRSVLRMT